MLPYPKYFYNIMSFMKYNIDLRIEVYPMWYIAHTTAGRELDAVDKCRKAIPEDIAAKVFSPIWQHAKKYEGSWHLDDDILFAGYIFIESNSDSKTLEKLH